MNRALAGLVFGVIAVSAPLATEAQTVVGVATSSPQFSSLVNAVVSQDLVTTLSGAGPFTVFAPTNDAFTKIPGFVSRAIAEKPALLKNILLAHVVSGDFDASEVLASKSLSTVGGERIVPNLKNGEPYINGSKITATDVVASNGRVHVIDKVIIPRDVVIESFKLELNRLQNDFRSLLSDLNGGRSYGGNNH